MTKKRVRNSLHSYVPPGAPTYETLPLIQRLKLAQYMLPNFNPTLLDEDAKLPKRFNEAWWNKLTGDEKSAVFWSCLFPERINKNWVDINTYSAIEFYSIVTRDNAEAWYYYCPTHLRRRIDERLAAIGNDPVVLDRVKQLWGSKPTLRHDDDIHTHAWLEEWEHAYQRETLIAATVELAPLIQEERQLLNKAMGLDATTGDFPSQAEGLDPTVSATVRWLQQSGEMPLEFLARTYRSDDAKMSDRLSAARTLMDYVHRKVPLKTETETKDISEPKLSPDVLKGLTEHELEVLEKLLAKLEAK